MIGRRFNLFNLCRILLAECLNQFVQKSRRLRAECEDLGDLGVFRQRFEPCDFYLNSAADQAEFREYGAQ